LVAGTSLVVALAGWALLALLERLTARSAMNHSSVHPTRTPAG
jgi:hypothetical protein